MIHGYKRVGKTVAAGEVLLELDEAEGCRQLAATNLLTNARSTHICFDEDKDSIKYSYYIRCEDEFDQDYDNLFLSIKLRHFQAPNAWNMLAAIASFKMAERESNKRIVYSMAASEEQVIVAKKSVFLILGKTAVTFDCFDEPRYDVTQSRKAYERPMTSADAIRLHGVFDRMLQSSTVT